MTDKLSTEAIRRLSGIVRAAKFVQTETEGVSLYGSMLTKLADEQDSELAAILKRNEELETENAVMRARLRRLLDASEHSGKMDWMGDDDPWGDAESAITRDYKLAELIGEGE